MRRRRESPGANSIPAFPYKREDGDRKEDGFPQSSQPRRMVSLDSMSSSGSQRRASMLIASRRRLFEAEGPQVDMDLHGTGVSSLHNNNNVMSPSTPLTEEAPAAAAEEEGIEVQLKEKTTNDNGIHDHKIEDDEDEDDDNHQNAKDVMEIETPLKKLKNSDEENLYEVKETPILLTQRSHSTLQTSSRSVLFAQAEDAPTKPTTTTTTTSPTIVYSWGSGVNSFHDHNNDVSLDQAQLDPSTSRVGRREIVACAMGPKHSACVNGTGQVLVKGRNSSGAVDPDQKDVMEISRPFLLESLGQARIVQVSCGKDHTAALRSNGAVLTWGSNGYGQLGHRSIGGGGNSTTSTEFVRPAIMSLGVGVRAMAVTCGDGFTLCLTSRMGLLACGIDSITGYNHKSDPAPIPALMDLPLVFIAAGRRHAVAVTAHGTVFAWGENPQGCCGREYPKKCTVPVPVKVPNSKRVPVGPALPAPLSNWAYWKGESEENFATVADDVAVIHAALGDDHTVLVTKAGRLFVCGSNLRGQLGIADTTIEHVYNLEVVEHPHAEDGRYFVQAEAGEVHTVLLDDIGDVWQYGGDSRLYDATSNDVQAATPVLQFKHIKWIAAGGKSTVAVAARPNREPLARIFSDQVTSEDKRLAGSVEDLLSQLLDEKKIKSNEEEPLGTVAKELANRMQELLRTPAVLNSLFLDPTELDDLYSKLLSVDAPAFRKLIVSAIENGIRTGLQSLCADDSRLMFPEQVRFLLLYLQCPLFIDWKSEAVIFDRRSDLILALSDVMLELPYEGYRALMCWATSTYSRENFVRFLIKPLLSQLGKGLSVAAGAETRPIPGIVAVLRWLYNSSERADNVVAPEDFHCEDLFKVGPEKLLEDLTRYKKANKQEKAGNFFLCHNSFLFSPDTKRVLLQMENEMNMLKTAASGLTYNPQARAFEFNPFWTLDIDREYLLTQTLDKISRAEPKDLRKKLKVVFKGEDGVDAGGVTREFFQLLSAQLFDVNTGMWTTRFRDGEVTWFNADCSWNDEGYFLSGVLVGLAVYNSVLLDVHFPQAVYRKLLGLPLGLEDMIDEEVKSGLQSLLDYEGEDVEDVFCLNFDVAWMDLGVEKRKELKPNGSNIAVTSDNKEEYVLLYTQWLLQDSIYPQYDSFEKGFMRVMENSSFDILLRPEELELLAVGTPELDFQALKKNAVYEGGYDAESDVIKCFWKFVESSSKETQLQLLKFSTGSPKAPVGGLGALHFKIQRAGPDSDNLPTSHTCFNTLLLPDYGDNYDKLAERLGRAVVECEGFGLQ